ncbi:hypothetical protein EV360DRAFT_47138 [Lentinula raphanica]|nr:hypothetical protein EV360DRAFT_47138 [Lentinula raphanica]
MSPSAPSPPASTSSNTSSTGSPQPDLELDPSDPLNLLLRNSQSMDNSMDESSSGESPPDWSQLSALWSSFEGNLTGDFKPFPDVMDYNIPINSELDFTSPMAIDPHALHFDSQKLGLDDFSLLSDTKPIQNNLFSFQSELSTSPQGRRLSVTSSSSSSGASLSPIIDPSPAPSLLDAPQVLPLNSLDAAAEELAQRVRQSAGIMLAVPMNGQSHQTTYGSLVLQQPASPQSLRSFGSSASSAASTPPPTTPPPTNSANSHLSIQTSISDPSAFVINPAGSASMLSRPKTSHTTIERRYRTNLNARITSLKMAVPALRVLEDKEGSVGGGGKKGKGKNSTLGKNVVFGSQVKKEGEDGEDVVDIIDERGFVDGVKVARKCSKANVLGKAVEYIRVLKKREHRLKREQDGLKALVNGLVGGPALLKEWEREWREKFGGEEKDEVEGEDIDDGGSDDEGTGDEEDADEDGARKRKRAKVTPAKKEPKEKRPPPAPLVLPDGSIVVPEKRKRGRPRKVVPPVVAATIEEPSLTQPATTQPQHPQHAQYLLATFALFSFFNNPLSSHPQTHSHTGTVLTHELPTTAAHYSGWSWHNVIQAFHLLVSILVFTSILAPVYPSLLKFVSTKYSSLRKVFVSSSASVSSRSHSVSLVDALSPFDDISLGKTSLFDRALICLHMRSHLSWFTASASDLSTLALALWPLGHFARRHARSIWSAARARKGFSGVREGGVGVQVRPHERLVLQSLTLDEAILRLKSSTTADTRDSDWNRYSPIGVLACTLVKERVKQHLKHMFIKTVFPDETCLELEDVAARAILDDSEDKEDEERMKTVESARSLGGKIAELGDTLQKMWTMGIWELDDISLPRDDAEEQPLDLDGEIRVLINTIILYRQIFSSSILSSVQNGHSSGVSILLSPPPSPSRQDVKLHYTLRRILGSAVFDADGVENGDGLGSSMEDARDRLVDMLVECERAGRSI